MIHQLGQLLATVINYMRGGKGRHMKADDFMPGRKTRPKQQTASEQFRVFNAFATTHNAAMKRKRESGK